MIYPKDDAQIKSDLSLTLDNLFDLFKVKSEDNDVLKRLVIKEFTAFLTASNYHKECKIS